MAWTLVRHVLGNPERPGIRHSITLVILASGLVDPTIKREVKMSCAAGNDGLIASQESPIAIGVRLSALILSTARSSSTTSATSRAGMVRLSESTTE